MFVSPCFCHVICNLAWKCRGVCSSVVVSCGGGLYSGRQKMPQASNRRDVPECLLKHEVLRACLNWRSICRASSITARDRRPVSHLNIIDLRNLKSFSFEILIEMPEFVELPTIREQLPPVPSFLRPRNAMTPFAFYSLPSIMFKGISSRRKVETQSSVLSSVPSTQFVHLDLEMTNTLISIPAGSALPSGYAF